MSLSNRGMYPDCWLVVRIGQGFGQSPLEICQAQRPRETSKEASQEERVQVHHQQVGAKAHTSNLSLEWIREKFGTRVISGNTEIPWPARSPDKAPCDYYLWGNCEAEIRRVKPSTLEELKTVVTDFCDSLDEEEVRRAVRDVRPRAELCLKMGGGHFESQLKKYKRGTLEE